MTEGGAGKMKKPFFMNGTLFTVLLFFGCFVAWPLFCMFSTLMHTDVAAIAASSSFRRALRATVVSAGLTTLCSMAAALLMAVLLSRTAVRGKLFWRTLFILPMLLPSVSNGSGLVLLLGNNGFLTGLLRLKGNIYGMQGIVLGQMLYTAPAAFLLLVRALEEEDYTPHEAAEVLGIPKLRRFTSVTLPFIRKDLIAAAFLVFSMSVTDYGIPLAVGGRIETLAVLMYAKVAGRLQFDKGSFIGLCLLLPAVLSFLADTRRRGRRSLQPVPFPERPDRAADRVSFLLCFLLSLVFVLPILAFCLVMLLEDYPLHMQLTLRHFAEVWNDKGRAGLKNSLALALGASVFGTVFASFAAYAASRLKGVLPRLVHILSLTVLSVPGLVLGLSYAMAFSNMPFYGGMGLMVVSGMIHFLTTPYLMLYQAFSKMDRDLESTGAVLGIPAVRIFTDIMLPRCRNTVLEMASFFFVNCMVTISAVVFLARASTRPLSLLVTQYSDQINPEAAAVLSFIILALNFAVRTLLLKLRRTDPSISFTQIE